MCLAIPMKIVTIDGSKGMADLDGVLREINLSLIDELKIGDFVIVHSGFAINKIDRREADETIKLLRELAAVGKEIEYR